MAEAFRKGTGQYINRVVDEIQSAGFTGMDDRDRILKYLTYQYTKFNTLPDKTLTYRLAQERKKLSRGETTFSQIDAELSSELKMSTRAVYEQRRRLGFVRHHKARTLKKALRTKEKGRAPEVREVKRALETEEAGEVVKLELVLTISKRLGELVVPLVKSLCQRGGVN